MKAIRIHSFGGPEVLRIDELPEPEPGVGELLVRVLASSVNPIDYKIRKGGRAKADQLPITIGADLAGFVERLGPGVTGFARDDRVFAMLQDFRGGDAERVTVPASACAIWPGRLDAIAAASVPLAALTAWQGLFQHGGLREGQRVLIHGAGGGVGHMAVQLAKARGARVSVTANAADRDFLAELGADQVIDYRNERFEMIGRVDLVLDLIGGETQDRSWALLGPGGILVSTVEAPSEQKAAERGAIGMNFVAHPDGGQLAEIASLIEAGEITPHIDRVFPLAEVAEAERFLEEQHVRGKVVLRVAEEV